MWGWLCQRLFFYRYSEDMNEFLTLTVTILVTIMITFFPYVVHSSMICDYKANVLKFRVC